MKRRILTWLLALTLILGGASYVVRAQEAALKAVTVATAQIYREPADEGDPLGMLDANTLVTVLSTDPTGAWVQIAVSAGEGYVMADEIVILTPAPLAPTVMVTSNQAGAPIFDTPDMAAEMIGSASFGDTARLLGEDGEWAYIVTWEGMTGWSISSAWERVDNVEAALIQLRATDAAGLFAEPNITAVLTGTLNEGQLVYVTGETDDNFVEVMTANGTTGWVDSRYLAPLPHTFVDATVPRPPSVAGLYTAPDFGADLVGGVKSGTTLTYINSPDSFWLELYSPQFGTAYGLTSQFSPVYTTATVRAASANVRLGPDADLYNSIAELETGTEVVVTGKTEEGDWVKVLLPFDAIDYPYRGVEGWMASFLFMDAAGETDLNLDILSIVE